MYYQRKIELLSLPEGVTSILQSNEISETHCIYIYKLVNRRDLVNRFEPRAIPIEPEPW